jgi:hypothetical protein
VLFSAYAELPKLVISLTGWRSRRRTPASRLHFEIPAASVPLPQTNSNGHCWLWQLRSSANSSPSSRSGRIPLCTTTHPQALPEWETPSFDISSRLWMLSLHHQVSVSGQRCPAPRQLRTPLSVESEKMGAQPWNNRKTSSSVDGEDCDDQRYSRR